jgi:hypothetical protein
VKTTKKSSTAIEPAKLEGLLTCAATRGLLQSYGRKAPRALSSCRYWRWS